MRTIRRAGLVVALFAIALTARAAHGTTWVSGSGTQCQTNDGDITHSMWGAYNPSPYYSDFVCPLPMATTSSYIQSNAVVALKYMDGNSVSDFQCKVCQADVNWNYHCSQPKHTCGWYGGCNDDSMTSYTGSGLLIWYQADLTIDVYNQYVTNNTTIRCEVPGYQNGTNIVTSYWAND